MWRESPHSLKLLFYNWDNHLAPEEICICVHIVLYLVIHPKSRMSGNNRSLIDLMSDKQTQRHQLLPCNQQRGVWGRREQLSDNVIRCNLFYSLTGFTHWHHYLNTYTVDQLTHIVSNGITAGDWVYPETQTDHSLTQYVWYHEHLLKTTVSLQPVRISVLFS